MHAYPLHDNPNRIRPLVPGINAQPLGPSIGVDNWRISDKRAPTPRLKQRARPITGKVDLTKIPASYRTGSERVVIEHTRARVCARKRKAMARAAHASRLAL
jgi:hypothetical protein